MTREDRRSASERRVRAAWRRGPGPGLRLGSLAFGLAADLRNLAYECGVAAPRRGSLPVLSVGGLTVGGSGKTPVAASAAAGLLGRGVPTAVVTRGFADEMAVHRKLNPGALVAGAPDRRRAVAAAADAGARAAVLDDGFQHRRLARDLEWTVLSRTEARRPGWSRLPAGPARDRWGELARCDAVIVTHRRGRAGPEAEGLLRRLRRQFPAPVVASCRFRAGGLRPANEAAEETEASPRVAFASVMGGEEFLDRQAEERPGVERTVLFPDHHVMEEETVAEMARAAGSRGLVGTLKDVVKIAGRLDPEVPLWYASEEVVWSAGARGLSRQLDHLAQLTGADPGEPRPVWPDHDPEDG